MNRCTSIESIDIPLSVKHIYPNACSQCFNLKELNYEGSEEQWNEIILESIWNTDVSEDFVINFNCSMNN